MCTSPRRILNRANHWDEHKPLYLEVPCGKCEECKQSNRNDWFCRCFYEWLSNRENGQSFYYTLTYNNDNLPHSMGVPCFSLRDLQLFLKRLRKCLSKRDTKLRYMITSEYGELYQRPHYHVLFFLDSYFNPYIFYRLIEQCWQKGFVKAGDNVGQITSYRGIKYVTKYVSKDFSHLGVFYDVVAPKLVSRANDFLHDMYRKYYNDTVKYFTLKYNKNSRVISLCCHVDELDIPSFVADDYNRALRFLRRVLRNNSPFHIQSSGLGIGMMESKHVSFEKEYSLVMTSDMNITKYKLPRYLKRKMWYDCVENEKDGKRNRFVLNQKGKEHYLSMLSSKIEDTQLEYDNILLNSTKKVVTKEHLDLVNTVLDTMKFENVDSLCHYINNIDIDTHILAIYNYVFRWRCNFIDDLYLTDEYVKNHYMKIADFHLSSVSMYDFGKVYTLNSLEKERLKYSTFNYHPYFRLYEEISQILDAMIVANKIVSSDATVTEDKTTRKVRQLLLKL